MKQIVFFILIFTNFFSISTNAEIAYIDINFILNTSKVGKYLNLEIEKKKKEHSEKYKIIENDLLKKEKSLLAQQNILSKDEFEKRFNVLSNEVQEYRKNKKLNLENLNKFKINNTKEILKVLNPIIADFVNLNSISIVIPKKNIIVGKKNLDITGKILELLNQNIDKLNF